MEIFRFLFISVTPTIRLRSPKFPDIGIRERPLYDCFLWIWYWSRYTRREHRRRSLTLVPALFTTMDYVVRQNQVQHVLSKQSVVAHLVIVITKPIGPDACNHTMYVTREETVWPIVLNCLSLCILTCLVEDISAAAFNRMCFVVLGMASPLADSATRAAIGAAAIITTRAADTILLPQPT